MKASLVIGDSPEIFAVPKGDTACAQAIEIPCQIGFTAAFMDRDAVLGTPE
jgi:hypothetical protein